MFLYELTLILRTQVSRAVRHPNNDREEDGPGKGNIGLLKFPIMEKLLFNFSWGVVQRGMKIKTQMVSI